MADDSIDLGEVKITVGALGPGVVRMGFDCFEVDMTIEQATGFRVALERAIETAELQASK